MPTSQDYLNQAGVQLPSYYRASDTGVAQFNYYKDALANATPANPLRSDLTDLQILGNLNGTNDPFYLTTLTNLASGGNIDVGTQTLAQRQLYQVNKQRATAGLSQIQAPGGLGFTEVAPTFNQVAPTAPKAPYNPGSTAPVYTGPAYPSRPTSSSASATAAYNAAVTAYNTAYSAYTVTKNKYTSDLAAYNAALPAYNTAVSTYNTQLQNYTSALNTYQTNLAGFQARKNAYDVTAQASDAALAVSQSRADEISKQIKDKAAADEQTRKMELAKFSLQGISKLFSGRAANTVTPSAVLTKKPTLGGI